MCRTIGVTYDEGGVFFDPSVGQYFQPRFAQLLRSPRARAMLPRGIVPRFLCPCGPVDRRGATGARRKLGSLDMTERPEAPAKEVLCVSQKQVRNMVGFLLLPFKYQSQGDPLF